MSKEKKAKKSVKKAAKKAAPKAAPIKAKKAAKKAPVKVGSQKSDYKRMKLVNFRMLPEDRDALYSKIDKLALEGSVTTFFNLAARNYVPDPKHIPKKIRGTTRQVF